MSDPVKAVEDLLGIDAAATDDEILYMKIEMHDHVPGTPKDDRFYNEWVVTLRKDSDWEEKIAKFNASWTHL